MDESPWIVDTPLLHINGCIAWTSQTPTCTTSPAKCKRHKTLHLPLGSINQRRLGSFSSYAHELCTPWFADASQQQTKSLVPIVSGLEGFVILPSRLKQLYGDVYLDRLFEMNLQLFFLPGMNRPEKVRLDMDMVLHQGFVLTTDQSQSRPPFQRQRSKLAKVCTFIASAC